MNKTRRNKRRKQRRYVAELHAAAKLSPADAIAVVFKYGRQPAGAVLH